MERAYRQLDDLFQLGNRHSRYGYLSDAQVEGYRHARDEVGKSLEQLRAFIRNPGEGNPPAPTSVELPGVVLQVSLVAIHPMGKYLPTGEYSCVIRGAENFQVTIAQRKASTSGQPPPQDETRVYTIRAGEPLPTAETAGQAPYDKFERLAPGVYRITCRIETYNAAELPQYLARPSYLSVEDPSGNRLAVKEFRATPQ